MTKNSTRETVSFDWAIKYILRDKANFEILEGFLMALLGKSVKIIELIESEGNQSKDSEKYNRVDVVARLENNEDVLIEVQYAEESYFFKRLLFGACRDIIDNLQSGSDYKHVKKVYCVGIVYFDVENHGDIDPKLITKENLPKIATDYVIRGKTTFFGFHNNKPINLNKKYLFGDEEFDNDSDIFPEYIIIPTETFNNDVNDNLDEWIYMFKNNKLKGGFNAPGIEKAKESLSFINMSDEEKKRYKDIKYAEGAQKGVEHFKIQKIREEAKKEYEQELENKETELENNKKELEDNKKALAEAMRKLKQLENNKN